MLPKRSSRSHKDGRLKVIVHQYGDDGPFGLEFRSSAEPVPRFDTTYATLAQAKVEADLRVQGQGHVCDESCTEWVDAARLGDKKPCIVDNCDGTMELQRVRGNSAFVSSEGATFPTPSPDYDAWVCNACEFEQHSN